MSMKGLSINNGWLIAALLANEAILGDHHIGSDKSAVTPNSTRTVYYKNVSAYNYENYAVNSTAQRSQGGLRG